MPKIKLDLGDDDDGEDEQLIFNKAYAGRYDSWRRLEELQKRRFMLLEMVKFDFL